MIITTATAKAKAKTTVFTVTDVMTVSVAAGHYP